MEIDETISKWFERIEDVLDNLSSEAKNTNIYFLIAKSLTTFGTYLHTAIMILSYERRLPAKALLRVSGQLVSRVVWVLKGRNEKERQNRLKRWIKDSYCESRGYDEKIVRFYAGDERALVEKRIKDRSEKINELEKCGIKRLPQPEQIFEQAFGKNLLAAGMYSQYHHATHPDLLVLAATVNEDERETIYEGDTKESIDSLKLNCLVQVYIFFEEVSKFYNFDFKGMAHEFQAIRKQVCGIDRI